MENDLHEILRKKLLSMRVIVYDLYSKSEACETLGLSSLASILRDHGVQLSQDIDQIQEAYNAELHQKVNAMTASIDSTLQAIANRGE